ncbi:uncharacterized protein sb:cb288 isoform X2 [Lates calcarifer]|uniref:Uncharacterized protein sb:cb288 isoform X2 n=1 Tax=Lates calcarifer TaxID=8187 RepID=A0AAJ8DUC5_LATCA|nr:uncharacterized protein sb:cb288 isoform X2 [Lates calcarifer]
MRSDRATSNSWTELKNKSETIINSGKSSKMVDPDVTRQLLHAVQQINDSTTAATRPSRTEGSLTRNSGIIPVLWKCMVSPPQRKHSKVRVRVQQRNSV